MTKQQIDRKYHLFDAKDKVVGRLATEVVKILRGKNKIDFTPHIDGGDLVVIINCDEIRVTGKKIEGKVYHRFSGYPGGISSINVKDQLVKDSRKIMKDAIYNMLPKNKLRARMMTRLLLYKDDKHEHRIEITH